MALRSYVGAVDVLSEAIAMVADGREKPMNLRQLDYYIHGRLFEWTMSISMILLGCETYIWPVTLRASAFTWILQVMSSEFVGLFMLIIGVIRCIALCLNGHALGKYRVGPFIRSSAAILCASMWVQFSLALLRLSILQDFPSPGIPFWSMFVLAELYVAYKAVLDAGRIH